MTSAEKCRIDLKFILADCHGDLNDAQRRIDRAMNAQIDECAKVAEGMATLFNDCELDRAANMRSRTIARLIRYLKPPQPGEMPKEKE